METVLVPTPVTEPETAKPPVMKMEAVHKSFSGVKVLHNVHLKLYKGEAHALMGENGALMAQMRTYRKALSRSRA